MSTAVCFMLILCFSVTCDANLVPAGPLNVLAETGATLVAGIVKIWLAAAIEATPVLGTVIDTVLAFFNDFISQDTSTCGPNCIWNEISNRVERASLSTVLNTFWQNIQINSAMLNQSLSLAYQNCSLNERNDTCTNVTYVEIALSTADTIARNYASYFSGLDGNSRSAGPGCQLLDSMGIVAMSHIVHLRTAYNLSVSLNRTTEILSFQQQLKDYYDYWMGYFQSCYCSVDQKLITENFVCDQTTYMAYRVNNLHYYGKEASSGVYDAIADANITIGGFTSHFGWTQPNTVTARLNEIRTELFATIVPFLSISKLVLEYADDPIHLPNWYNCGMGVNGQEKCGISYFCIGSVKYCEQVYNGPGVALGPYGTGLGNVFGNQQGDGTPGTSLQMDATGSLSLA